MNTTAKNAARLRLMQRQDLLAEVRRQQRILATRAEKLTPAGRAILLRSTEQKLAQVEALRTGKPAATTVTIERERAF